jgi:hypothetical protein
MKGCVALGPALAAALVASAACAPGPRSPESVPRTLEVVATVDLPKGDARSHELSAIAWVPSRGLALVLSDEVPALVELRPSPDLREWTFGATLPVRGIDPWDGEGLALVGDRRFVASERPPRVVELDADGAALHEFPLPEGFRLCRRNRCLESLAASADGRYLFTANESALIMDGPGPTVGNGAALRFVRIDIASGERVEWPYTTDPVCAAGRGGEIGVSDLVSLAADDLLVLERCYVPEVRNRIRVYRVRLSFSKTSKELLFDLGDLDPARPFVPNYEGMTLGPRLADGRRTLLLVSDDNKRDSQRATLLVVALPP